MIGRLAGRGLHRTSAHHLEHGASAGAEEPDQQRGGQLSAEIFGSLTSLVADTGTLYRAHIRAVMASMGYDPGLAESATEPGPAAR